jgi:hypothetical protein
MRLKDKQGLDWIRIRNKGMSRFIWEQVAIYCVGGLALMGLLALSVPKSLPLPYWIGGVLFAAFCGGLAAWEKWERGRF